MVNRFIKLLSMFLAVVLLVNMLPLGIFAEEFVGSLSAQETVTTLQAQKSDTHVVAELTDKRTQYTKEFLLSNGLHMATVYADPVHYEKDGQWAEIDNTLKVAKNGTVINTAGAWNVSFPNQLSGNNCITIEKDGYTLSFYMAGELRSSGELMTAAIGTGGAEQLAVSQMQTATASIQAIDKTALEQGYMYPEAAPKKLDSQLRYNGVYANTDVVYDLQSDTVKESIIMDAYSRTLRGYRYTLNVGPMIPVLDEWGDITFYAPDGKTAIMTMPAPFMMDANNEYNDDIQVQLTGSGSTYTLTYLLPQEWLAAENRAWPVILDPVIKASRDKLAIRDQTVCELQTISETKTVLDAGYEKDRGIVRAYLKYLELPPLTSSDVVVEAYFTLHKVQTSNTSKTVEVHKVTNPWPEGSLNWANQPEFRTDISDFRHVKNEGLYDWTVTEIVRSWYTDENNGLMIKMSNDVESGASGDYFRQFYSSDTGKYNRPTLQIVFLNNNGLEGTWDYTSTSAGRAGTGSVNNFTGNLVWVRNDMGFGGNRMPVSIDHVYNANDAIVHPDAEGQVNNANDSGGNYFGLGVGWRTNYHQRVFQWKCDDATGDSNYYIWEDGDGTDHYFKKSSTSTYKDEEGLEMTLKTNGSGDSTFTLKTKKGNTSYFDSKGRLTKIENNQATKSYMTVTYASDTGYEIKHITDGAGRVYKFTYNNGLLSSIAYWGGEEAENYYEVRYVYNNEAMLVKIIDNACDIVEKCKPCEKNETNKEIVYEYNDDGILKSASDIDGYKVTYEYTREKNTQLVSQEGTTTTTTPQWEPPYIVSKISTAHGNSAGGSMEFTYGYNETRMKDHNGNVQTIQFNDYGLVVGIMDDEGHAQYAKYAANAHTDTGKANQLTFSSKLQNTVGNLLNDSSFENRTFWKMNTRGTTQILNDVHKYYGELSLQLMGSVYNSPVAIPAGETYTLSAYVKADDAATIGFLVGGTTASSTTIPVNTEWIRYEVSYTNNTDGEVQATPFLTAGSTKGACFDCVQLEKSPTASRYNLVENGDFRYTGDNSYWTLHDDCTSLDIYTAPTTDLEPAAPQLDETCFSITGNRTKTKNISQKIKVSGKKGDSFVFAGWAAGYAIPQGSVDGDTRRFAVRARFKYTDGKYSDYEYASFQPTIQDDKWQYASKAIVAKKDYTEITIGVVYHYNVNTVYFDGIQLFKEEFGTSYTYDEDGNVVSSVDLQKKNTTYEYSNNDLTKILENGKEKVTYTYDKYHNVKTAKTEEGLLYTFTYDTYGNNISVSIGDGDTKITSKAHYHKDDNNNNDAERSDEGNYLEYTVDALGKITNYGYDPDTNILKWTQYPNDKHEPSAHESVEGTNAVAGADNTDSSAVDIDTCTKYTYDSMYRSALVACTTDIGANMSIAYAYENDYLKSIATPTTIYNYTYGSFGLRESVKVGTTDLVSYTYSNDPNKDLEAIKYGGDDGNGNGKVGTVRYTYDNKGRVKTETYEDGDTIQYLYNNDGNLAKKIEYTGGQIKLTTTYYYDLLDRMVKYEETGTNYSHSISYEYDENTNLSEQVEVINGVTTTTAYDYDDDNRVTSVTTGSTKVEYEYDAYGRLKQKVTKNGTTAYKTETYTYKSSENSGTSTQIDTHKVVFNKDKQTYTYSYTYDNNGNIKTISDGGNTTTYAYDSANQLISEDYKDTNQPTNGYTHTWEYDNAGNILNRTEYAYTSESLGNTTEIRTVEYAYPDVTENTNATENPEESEGEDGTGAPEEEKEVWRDKLSAYDGKAIVYDAIGNPLSIGVTENSSGRQFTWEHGRQLKRLQEGTTTWTYEYNADGMRTKRTNGPTTYEYTYNGSKLTQMKVGTEVLNFTYDANGMPLTVTMNGDLYYYVTNINGDVIRILDSDGCDVACYTYDAWGVCASAGSDSIGQYNPLRYRGYIYDDETQLYYLQSRYYDPEMGRFINADDVDHLGVKGLISYNLFTYCGNNPVMGYDPTGAWDWGAALSGAGLLATGLTAIAAAATILTCGAAAPLMVAVAAVTATAGVLTTVNGVAEVVEAGTGYNVVRDGVFGGNTQAYETYRDVTSTVAEIGTAICGSYYAAKGGNVCFVAGTLVQSEQGAIPIENVSVGTMVWAWDEKTGNIALKEVVETYISETDELVHLSVNGKEIVCTPSHPFYSPVKGWTDAVKLRADDVLVLINGEYVVVEQVQHEILEAPIPVYNFQVKDYHTYFVTKYGVLVHNKCGPKFNKDQQDLISMAKEYKRTGINSADADALWELTEYTGLDKITSCHPPKFDSYLGGTQLHLKINGMHINIFDCG